MVASIASGLLGSLPVMSQRLVNTMKTGKGQRTVLLTEGHEILEGHSKDSAITAKWQFGHASTRWRVGV